MTILQYITPSRLAGAEYFFLRVIEHLARKGHRVHVVTKRDTPLRAEVEKLLPLGVQLHAWHTHGKIDPKTLGKLCTLIRSEGVELINTHLTTASWQGAIAGKITGVPTVAVVHATDRKTWFQHADHLIAVSGGVRDALIAQGVPASKIEVLYHGIDLSQYRAPLSPPEAKTRLGLPSEAKTVGVAASFIPRKGHRFLLEALSRIETQTGPIHALFAGEGELEQELRSQASELGRADRTHFLGFRRDVSEVMCAMDAFCLPSLKEGLSIAVMEAMALERPVVVSNIAGLPEVVRDGQTGFLVPPGDVGALGESLLKVLTNEPLAAQLGHQAREFLEAHFEQSSCLNAMEAYFERIVRESQAEDSLDEQALALPTVPPAFMPLPKEVKNAPDVPTAMPNLPAIPLNARRQLTILQYITPSRIGGAERYFLRLIQHLALAGHHVIVVTKRDTPLRSEVEKLSSLGIELHAWHTHGKVDPATLRRLCSLVRESGADLINTHLTTASWIGSLAGRITGVPVVARVPATDRARFFQFADHLIAVSHGVREHLLAQGVSPEKVAVFYNGIDLRGDKLAVSPRTAKTRLGLWPQTRTIGVAASLIPRKGHRFLLEALKNTEDTIGPVHALFAGEGDQEGPLRELAAKLDMADRVHFLGFRNDILEVLAAMDAFCLPSLKEGLSNAVMEAMLLRRPVIATDIAGMPEIVRNGETGVLVPPGDVGALEEALIQIFTDEGYAAQLGRNAHAFLEAHYDQNVCLSEVEDYLQRVVWHSQRDSRRRSGKGSREVVAAR